MVSPDSAPRRSLWVRSVGVFAVLAIAAFLRLDGLHWDALHRVDAAGEVALEEQHLHPDERFLTMVTNALGRPESWSAYFETTTSPLNPHNRGHGFFAYGTLPIFLTKAVASLAEMDDYGSVHVVGRVLSAAFSLLTVLLTFVLAWRLFGRGVAVLASLFLALAALPIQQAHFYTVDSFGDTFVALALLFAVAIQRRGRLQDYLGFGVAMGLAMACKLNLVLLAAVAVVAAASRALVPPGQPEHPTRRRASEAGWALAGLVIAAAGAFVMFRLLQPYAFTGPGFLDLHVNPRWWANMEEVRELVGGLRDFPPGHQWAGRSRPWFPWKNIVLWGLGPALGIAAWAGWALAGWELARRRRWEHLVPWSWVLLLFGYQGVQWVTSMRYFLPIYPALCLFAALLVARLWRFGRSAASELGSARRLGAPRRLASVVAILVVAATAAWAWGFSAIYRRPHSRIQASRWIYANVPPGAMIANEVWDDGLPLRIEGKDGFSVYHGIDLHNYAEDNPEKLEQTLDSLSRANVLVLSSNRLYDSIPRLPMRYPMMVRYYEHLFSGELGFRRVAEFTSYPTLLGFEFPDQKAEEAWSVYDHPRVQIFVRTPQWSVERARELLTPPDWGDIDRLSPRDARDYRTLMMDPALQRAQRAGGTWLRRDRVSGADRGLFSLGGFASRHPVLAWVAVLEVLGLVAFPLCFAIFPRFADRGWMLAKTIGLLLTAVLGWAVASLRWLPWSRATIWGLVIALGGLSLAVAWRRRPAILSFARERAGLVLGQEVLFWCFFGFLVWCRYQNPDLWHAARGGEKPMDFAYLNAVVKSTYFPPYDPWFAGGYINYYYFGFVLAAVPVLLTGVMPTVAYNLIVPTFFALTAAGAFTGSAALAGALRRAPAGAGWLGRRLVWGVVGAILVVAAGNLTEISVVARGLRQLAGAPTETSASIRETVAQAAEGFAKLRRPEIGWPLPNDWWFWNASRAIPHPQSEPPAITEFPFFTFLFADLHAHMMAMPITLLVLALAIHMALAGAGAGGGDPPVGAARPERAPEAATLGLLALAVGGLFTINTWDYPLGLLLASVGLLLRETAGRDWLRPAAWWRAGWRIAAVAAAGRLAFYWFHDSFVSAYTEASRWTGARTPFGSYLAIHGLFLLLLLTWVAIELELGRRARDLGRLVRSATRWRSSTARRRLRRAARGGAVVAVTAGGGLLVAAVLLALGLPLEAFLAAALLVTAALALERRRDPIVVFVCLAIMIGLALSALVEHMVLSGDIGRMNTVFKFYLQIWLLWGTCAAAALAAIVSRWGAARRPVRRERSLPLAVARAVGRWSFATAAVVLAAAALLYTALATPARLRDRFDETLGPSLDGGAFLATATHHDQQPLELRWDGEAFQWLRENVIGNPVLLEASIPPYRWGSRVSMFTGLPTVLGWDWHQKQQRSIRRSDPVGRRVRDIQQIYSSPDAASIVPLLERYAVELVYVGQVERAYYPEEGWRKFAASPELFTPLYSNDEVQIYRVVDSAPPTAPPLVRKPAAARGGASATG